MSNLPDICGDGFEDRLAGSPAIDPFRSLNVHFGMLMGVDDFETIDAYHRGKMWLHTGWLHRRGCLWGLKVEVNQDDGQVRVQPGLAIDGWGRELYLEQAACLDIGEWAAEHREVLEDLGGGQWGFTGHVVIDFQGCFARQVPALVEPCDTAARSTAYSRLFETVRLELRPARAPDQFSTEYPRLRLFFGLRDSDGGTADEEIVTLREQIPGLSKAERPAACLEAFRDLAAEDSMEHQPALDAEGEGRLWFPNLDTAIVLAEIADVVLEVDGDGFTFVSSAEENNTVRPTLVATEALQELLCGCSCAEAEEGDGGDAGDEGGEGDVEEGEDRPSEPPEDAGGPRAVPETACLDGRSIRFGVTGNLVADCVKRAAFEVSSLVEGRGWKPLGVQRASFNRGQKRVTVRLRQDPPKAVLRVLVKGTGPTPLLGEGNIPFAGGVGGPPGTVHDGHDFALMIDRS